MSANLHILQVSPLDIGGGAEKVALDLHHAYLARGLDAWLAVATRNGEDSNVVLIPSGQRGSAWSRALLGAADAVSTGADGRRPIRWALDRVLRSAANPTAMLRIQRGLEDFAFRSTRLLPSLAPTPPSVLHLHNLHGGYFDIRVLPELTAQFPTILTMHDVWPLTGHCAYPLGCERWQTGCGDCPDLALPISIRRDSSAENHRIKRAALTAGRRLRVATPSRWLMGLVEQSGLADSLAETRVIPNGVDTDIYCPGDRSAARAELGLPLAATIVLFSARSAKSSPFKGFATLEAALPLIARAGATSDLLLVALGEESPDASIDGVPIRFVPFAEDPATVARYYRAADLYLHPAHAENFPLAILEAMACGAPVVASDTGGIPEIVADGETGALFANGDAGALAAAATALLGDPSARARMGQAGRERILREFTLDRQVDSYLRWYEEILSS